MASNQASMARRQRERASQQARLEKQAQRQARREQKKLATPHSSNDPMNDPSIDWGQSVRETHIPDPPEPEEGEAAAEP